MILAGNHTTERPSEASLPVGGDPSKPGAWTQEQIDDWNRVKACADEGHAPFWAMDPRPSDDTCPGCNAIIRSVTTAQGWIDHWAEQAADERAHRDAWLAEREDRR